MYIYKITNTINKKIYIGQTIQKYPKNRWSRHIYNAKVGEYGPLYNAIRKYGKDLFVFEIIYQSFDIDDLNEKEIFFISYYNSTKRNIGYNVELGGKTSKMSEETKKRLSEKIKNQFKNGRPAVRARVNMPPWNKGLRYKTGRKLNPEQIELLRIVNSKPKTESHKKNLSIARKEYYKNNINPLSKKVLCLNTNQIFDSAADASRFFNFPVTAAARVCNGQRKAYKGYVFKYINDPALLANPELQAQAMAGLQG